MKKKPNEVHKSFCIPVLQIPSAKLSLRSDIVHLLAFAGIDYKNLLSYEDCVELLGQSKERVNLHLVDHNVLTAHFSAFDCVRIVVILHLSALPTLLITVKTAVCIPRQDV